MDSEKTERGYKFRIEAEKNEISKKKLKKLREILKIKELESKNTPGQTKIIFLTESKHYTRVVHEEAAEIIGKNIKTTIEKKSDEVSPGYSEEDCSSNNSDASNKHLFAEKVIQRVLEGEEIEAVVKSYPAMKDQIEMTFIVPFLKEGALFVRSVHAAKNNGPGGLNQASEYSNEQNTMQKADENKEEQQIETGKLKIEDIQIESNDSESYELNNDKDNLQTEKESLPGSLLKVKSIKEVVDEAEKEEEEEISESEKKQKEDTEAKILKKAIKKDAGFLNKRNLRNKQDSQKN